MCNPLPSLSVDKYVTINGLLSKNDCTLLSEELKNAVEKNNSLSDDQCKSPSIYGHPAFEQLLLELLPRIEIESGKALHPTYSYARLYQPGDTLENHIDRPACEVSVTITLGFDGEVWPIYMGDDIKKSNASRVDMDAGDAVLYLGTEKYHWREKYTEGNWQAQVFLHYVDANGPNTEWVFDKRSMNQSNVVVQPKDNSMLYRVFDDVLSPSDCNHIVSIYRDGDAKREMPVIGHGDGIVDTSIRNVERIMIPTYKELGGQLAAIGLSCNHFNWKFDITHANQAEFLIYPSGGRYQAHIDTFIEHSEECRKLTVLAFLNDDFIGGKFYIQDGSKKIYPPQSKGTIIVFPSFLTHGVEDVESGSRYSAVCWMVGKFFR